MVHPRSSSYWNTPVGERTSRRTRNPNPTYYTDELMRDFSVMTTDDLFLADMNLDFGNLKYESSECQRMFALNVINTDEDGLLEYLHPLALAAKSNSKDIPNFQEALNGPDGEGFYKAMEDEMETLENKVDCWDVVPRSKDKNILPGTWAFRRKRFPDGTVKKLKARFCVRGDKQIPGVDCAYDTYAPVVAWSVVRLLLILTVALDLKTKQVDYTLAFCHAPVTGEVYVEMPRMFAREGHVLKLKKNLYGQKDAPLNFFLFLKEELEKRGFKQLIDIDPCLFTSEDVICVVHVDDCLFFAKEAEKIDEVIESMENPPKDQGLNSLLVKVEDDVAGFLGILMVQQEDGGIEFKQEGLIKRILM